MTENDADPTAPDPALLDAFWAYERALMANDLDALDEWFAPGPETFRGDAAGILVGHGAISDFRRSRGGSPQRTVPHVEVRPIDDDTALVVAVTAPLAGGRGQQTQLWRHIGGAWRIAAAHVALPAPAIQSATWRVLGTPLVTGAPTGPLAGHTVAVKDLFAVAGQRVGAGVPEYLAGAAVQEGSAPAVDALLSAGASVTGIAQTDEFAYSIAGRNPHYGTPPNPAVVGAIPGGSSSGPASAVAQGHVTIGLGTDTGGSIRVPASYLGLWGLRTTHGSVAVDGLVPLSPSFDTVGWLTRDAATLTAAATTSLRLPPVAVERRLLVAPALLELVEPDVRAAFDEWMRGRPATQVHVGDLESLVETFRTIQAAEAWRTHGEWIEAHPGALGAEIASRFAWAAGVSSTSEAEARVERAEVRRRLGKLLGDAVLVLPAASSVAPSATADPADLERVRAATLRLTCLAGLTGRPAVSAPLLSVPLATQFTPAPVGVCFVGPVGSDVALVEFAASL